MNASLGAHRGLAGWSEPDALAVSTWRNSGQLSHGDHDESEVTPEDFLWETLPGRCCFSGKWDPNQRGPDGGPKWVSVTECGQCQVWGQADASCHNGECEAVVYYEAELKGSCVLCADLNNMVPTPKETTRIYSRVNAPAPPAPLESRVKQMVARAVATAFSRTRVLRKRIMGWTEDL